MEKRIPITLSDKQSLAYHYLNDEKTTEILYGGAAGGGKSWLGCVWQIKNRLENPGTRGLIGRAKLKNLKQTTLNTFFEVAQILDQIPNEDFTYNQQDSTIHFTNGSEILLKDLFLYPSDPNFTSLGSLEITDAFIDEANEISEKAVNIVNSRIRYKLNKPPKMLLTCNPSKSWLYARIYKPAKTGDLPEHTKFVQAFVDDNPNEEFVNIYKTQLGKLDDLNRERLLYGNWEYDDDKAKLFQYDAIQDLFTNDFIEGQEYFISCDAARKGSDKCVIILWQGWRVVQIQTHEFSLTTFIESEIHKLAKEYKIPRSNIVVDEDGIGGGVIDHLKCRGFVNNSKALKEKGKERNYANLKSQCYFEFAELVNRREVYIPSHQTEITEELEVIKQHNPDKDGKLQVEPKDKIKERLGRSPDFADALMMRYIFVLKRYSIGAIAR